MNADHQARPILNAAATGYAIVLPPGWRRIPLRSDTDRAIRAAVKQAMMVLPNDAAPDRLGQCRLELERRLTEAAKAARRKGGIDMYLPAGPVYEAPVAASFLVSETYLAPADQEQVVALLAAGDDVSQPVTLDGADGVRVERTATSDETELPSLNVDYIVPIPGRPGHWLTIAFSTLTSGASGAQLSRLLTQLFDAIMSTFEWQKANR